MQFDGALIKEQGVTFAIVVVQSHILNSNYSANQARVQFSPFFPGLPIILMAQNSNGISTYHGREDIVNFLANLDISQIPWETYTTQ